MKHINRAMHAMDDVSDNMEDYVVSKYQKMRNFFSGVFRRSRSAETPSPRRSPTMTIQEKGPSKVQTPNEQRPGSSKSETRRESRRDSDLLSTATSALRRLNFRSAGGSNPRRVPPPPPPPPPQNGPPLQQMGSSTTSETTTNTSTDSSNTAYTLITVTDTEQEDKSDHDLLETKALLKDDKLSAKSKENSEPRKDSRDQTRRSEILDDFDELFLQSERRANADKSKGKAIKNGVKSNQGTGAVGGYKKVSGNVDNKKLVTTVTVQDRADKGKPKKFEWPPKKGKQWGFADDKQAKTAKMQGNFFSASSSERDSDETFSSMEEQQALASGGPPPTPLAGKKFFLKPSMADEGNIQNFEPIIEDGDSEENKSVKMEKPKSNIRTIQSELPQRTFSTNFNKRKKVGDLEERRSSQAELDKMSYRYSPTTSPKSKNMDDTRFPFPPRSHSPIPMSRSTSPRLKREMSTSLRKLSDTPIHNYRSGAPRKPPTHTAVAPLTLSNLEKYEMQVSQEVQRYRSNFSSKFDLNSPISNSPSFEKMFSPNENASGFEYPICTSSTESNFTYMDDDSDDHYFGNFAADVTEDEEKTMVEDQARMSHKRKKRHDRKSISLDTSDEESRFAQSRKSRDAFLSSASERNIDSPQSRKYSVLTTDGSVKNFVSENSEEFKKTGENINKENIEKQKTARRSSECPQRHRRVSIIQGESLRTFVFEEPDTSRMKPSKQRKVSKVIEDTTRKLLLEDVQPRKSSLAPGDSMKMGEESPRKSSIAPEEKPRKFSINTLGDIVSARKFSLLPPGEIYTSQVDGKTTEVIKLPPVTKGKPLATIVVQQASIQRGSVSGPSGQREESFLDAAHAFTLDELHEFDMKYGSPHHCRSQSVKTPGRSCGRPNYLCLPQQRSRVASMPNTGVEEEYYRLRHFSITGKGLVLNRGDSLKSRRSRSNNSVASSNSSHSTDHLATNVCTVGSYPGSARTSAECSLASSRDSSTTSVPYKVVMLGSAGVGKTSLISQFMTSEYLHAYDTSLDEEYGEKSVSVLLDDEESELIFVDHSSADMSPENCITTYQPQAYVIVYAVVDRVSFQIAEEILQSLWRTESIGTKAVILVGNKADLVRCRTVTYEEGVNMAKSYDCKFIETSVGINHNVDELLVGVLTQIRLKLQKGKPKRNKSPFGRDDSPRRWRNTRLSASLKVKGLLGRVLAREGKSKSCENLHVL